MLLQFTAWKQVLEVQLLEDLHRTKAREGDQGKNLTGLINYVNQGGSYPKKKF